MDGGKKGILSIRGNQVNPDGEDNRIELITEGRLYKKGNAYYIEYEESAISGLEGTKTLIMVEDRRISLERTGAPNPDLFLKRAENMSITMKRLLEVWRWVFSPQELIPIWMKARGNLGLSMSWIFRASTPAPMN